MDTEHHKNDLVQPHPFLKFIHRQKKKFFLEILQEFTYLE